MTSIRTGPAAGATPSTNPHPSRDTNEQHALSPCEAFISYPSNLNRSFIFEHTLELYRCKLHDESERLFNPSPRIKLLKFWDTNESSNGFQEYIPSELDSLKDYCQNRGLQDPTCRYVFIQSKNARARLELTKEELTYLLSYHQVMPPFLDLLFTCGRQEKLKDFHYTAFRHENYLEGDSNFKSKGLDRSDRQIQHCYNLHSVERSRSVPGWGWSIRQTVVYHSFDIETGKSLWIFIKGNDVIQKRIVKATTSMRCADMSANSHKTLTGSFSASLIAHTHMMEWCGEQWRWYINDMEDRLRDKAKNTILVDVDDLAGPTSVPAPSRPGTLLIPRSARTTVSKQSPTSPTKLWSPFARFSTTSKAERGSAIHESGNTRPIHADYIVEEPEQIDADDDDNADLEHLFSFQKLQDLHRIGEYMQEALMVLGLNRNIIREIREHYVSLTESKKFPAEVKDRCRPDISKFSQRALSIEKDLEVQQSRLETLNVLLEDRSNLFHTVQQYASMQASKHFAKNAQASTDCTIDMTARMHVMTEKMHDIALKTNNQTLSMHVITVFTLVFLPGTFLAVRLLRRFSPDMALIIRQTFFSSGILQWSDKEDPTGSTYTWVTEKDRLNLFLEIVIPMMALIIVGWLVLYFRSKTKRNEDELRQSIDLEKGVLEPSSGEASNATRS